MLTYSECRALMESARNPERGKPLANNTRLYERKLGQGAHLKPYYAVEFHSTDVVEIYANGTYGIRTGGWQTLTTRERITSFSPLSWAQLSGRIDTSRTTGDTTWYLRIRPSRRDPEPPRHNHIEVSKPSRRPRTALWAEPQSCDPEFGSCVSGTNEAYTFQERLHIWTQHSFGLQAPPPGAHPVGFSSPDTPNECSNYVIERVGVLAYGSAESYWQDQYEQGHGYNARMPEDHTYVQCRHCAKFRAALARWTAARNAWNYYNAGCDTYGSEDAWRAAWREDRQRVIQANRAWTAWDWRNKIELDGLIRINGDDGYPLTAEVRAVRSRQHKLRKEMNRQRRAREARERHQRQVERFARGIRRRRKPTFATIAADLAATLDAYNKKLDERATTNELES